MKTLVSAFLSLVTILSLVGSASASNAVRISQVYGGGGAISGNTAWDSDYVELLNVGPTPVNLSGWAIEYGLSSGNYGTSPSNIFVFPEGASIAPCSYVLVAMTPGLGGFPLPVTPDYLGTLQMNATNGKVALFTSSQPNITCAAIAPAILVDKVSYGTGTCPETAACAALSVSHIAVRGGEGMNDTDDNSSDLAPVAFAEPHNSESLRNPECLAVPASSSTWGQIKGIYRK